MHTEHAGRARQLEQRLHQVYHHLAVLVARLASHRTNHGKNTRAEDLLPIPGLGVDTELRDLLDPPTPPATPAAGCLVVYLRALILLHHGLGYPTRFSTVADNLTTVVATGALPDHDTLTALINAYPMLHAYAAPLHRAALAELAGRPVPLTTVDTRTPTERRLQDADTVQLHGTDPSRRPPPPPPPRRRAAPRERLDPPLPARLRSRSRHRRGERRPHPSTPPTRRSPSPSSSSATHDNTATSTGTRHPAPLAGVANTTPRSHPSTIRADRRPGSTQECASVGWPPLPSADRC